MAKLSSFETIFKRAAKRKGAQELEKLLPTPKSARSLTKIDDSRYLSQMAKCIFRAGFVWRVVENKWDDFETVFDGFEPGKIASKSAAQMAQIAKDERVIRNRAKISAVRDNAVFVSAVSAQHGGFGKFVAKWPEDDLIGLFEYLKKHGSRLGGHTGQYFLRSMGKDTFIFSTDMVKALVREGLVTKEPTSEADLRRVQEAFNTWAAQSGRPLCQISRVLACSVD